MPDEVDAPEPEDALTPDAIANHTFHTAFRGFDPVEVRAFLGRVADLLRDAEVAGTAPIPAEAESVAPAVADTATTEASVDPGAAAALAAEAVAEAEEILRDARVRAAAMESEAAAEGHRIVESGRADAEGLVESAKAEAEALLRSARSRARSEAGRDATRLRAEAEQAAAELRVDAERQAAKLKQAAEEDAKATIEAARDRGREMVVEAQAARERMLTDLARRKRAAQAQLEQLRTARDRMLETLKSARRSVDEITLRFDGADSASGQSRAKQDDAATASDRSSDAADDGDRDAPRASAEAPSLPSLPEPTEAGNEGVRIIGTRPVADAPKAVPQAARPERVEPPATPPAPPEQSAPSSPARPAARSGGQQGRKPERRSSALRILRRGRSDDEAQVAAPDQPVDLGRLDHQQGEGVRILASTASEAEQATADAEAERQPAAPTTDNGQTQADAEAAVPAAGVADDAAAGTAEELAADPAAGSIVEAEQPAAGPLSDDIDVDPELAVLDRLLDTIDVDAADEADGADGAEGVEPVGKTDAVGHDGDEPLGEAVLDQSEGATAVTEEAPAVDDIFARIRAEREATTAKARQVLRETAGPAGASDDASESSVVAPTDEVSSTSANAPTDAPLPAAAADAEAASARVDDADESLLQQRDEAVADVEESLTRRLKRTLQDEQNAALDRLRTHRGSVTVDVVLGSPDEQAAPYREVSATHLEPAARSGAAASPMGTASVAVDDLATQLAQDLAGSLRQRLDQALVRAAQEDLEVAGVAERINSVYREWKTQRIEQMAIHYISAAYNRGMFLATPEGALLRWVFDDEGPCPDCDDNVVGGPTPRGQAYPTGQMLPPAHPGCRCLLAAATA